MREEERPGLRENDDDSSSRRIDTTGLPLGVFFLPRSLSLSLSLFLSLFVCLPFSFPLYIFHLNTDDYFFKSKCGFECI